MGHGSAYLGVNRPPESAVSCLLSARHTLGEKKQCTGTFNQNNAHFEYS